MKKDIKILVVEDEPEMAGLITDYLQDVEEYTVFTARNGKEALESIQTISDIDLILSDINMPLMKGFELLNEVRKQQPRIKRILMTAYNVEDYLELAMKYDIGNIFAKTTPFNFKELSSVITSLLQHDIFGADKLFGDETNVRIDRFLVRRGNALNEDAKNIVNCLPQTIHRHKMELVLVELLTNAIFYGIRNESAEDKDSWEYDFILSEDEAIRVDIFQDDQKYAISIYDNGGRLNKSDVLYWLHRQIACGEDGMILGLFDSHGRGLFITRKYIDRVIINIQKNVKTEIIIVNYLSQEFKGYKPLYINEV